MESFRSYYGYYESIYGISHNSIRVNLEWKLDQLPSGKQVHVFKFQEVAPFKSEDNVSRIGSVHSEMLANLIGATTVDTAGIVDEILDTITDISSGWIEKIHCQTSALLDSQLSQDNIAEKLNNLRKSIRSSIRRQQSVIRESLATATCTSYSFPIRFPFGSFNPQESLCLKMFYDNFYKNNFNLLWVF